MAIGFIGAGKVGFSMGKFFMQGGVPVTGYYSRRQESAQEAASFTNTKAYAELEELVQDSDALFLTVPDGEITKVFLALSGLDIKGKQICHCSGAMTAGEAFPGIGSTGAYGYSIHPLFPISSKYETYRELTDAFFCMEGEGPHLSRWEALFRSLGTEAQTVPAEGKARYHAACAAASNLVCALAEFSLEIMEGCGFRREEALQALTPLMRSNLEHILQKGPEEALTGPVERCDVFTVQKHMHCLPEGAGKELYRAASLKLLGMARRRHPERDWPAMEAVLQNEKEMD